MDNNNKEVSIHHLNCFWFIYQATTRCTIQPSATTSSLSRQFSIVFHQQSRVVIGNENTTNNKNLFFFFRPYNYYYYVSCGTWYRHIIGLWFPMLGRVLYFEIEILYFGPYVQSCARPISNHWEWRQKSPSIRFYAYNSRASRQLKHENSILTTYLACSRLRYFSRGPTAEHYLLPSGSINRLIHHCF